MAPPDFSFCTVCNTQNEVTHAFGGDMEGTHAAAVEVVRKLDSPAISSTVDLLIVSCGGTPYDVNMIQAIKAVLNNFHIVKPGGYILFLAQCPEGTSDWLRDSCAIQDEKVLHEKIRANQLRQSHNALWIRKAREHAKIIMVTDMPAEAVAAFGFSHSSSYDEAMEAVASKLGNNPRTAVIPFGNVTVAKTPATGQ
jgi:nickel-dependent lactate racemase